MPARPAPIAILSYNRPDYLRPVLESLRGQTALGDPARVHLFQDGGREDGSHAEERAACIAAFAEMFPGGVLMESPANLGIALNFDRAERHVFEALDAEVGYFFEDDMVLSPHYLAALDAMADYALREPRIGYVAAYGMHAAEDSERAQMSGSITNMGHKWGFALTRRHWQRIRPMVTDYLRMIGNRPYHERDSPRIRQYFASLGTNVNSTSQDSAKLIATVQAGATDVMCHDCYAHYIGRIGQHFRDRIYERLGYDRTRMAEGPPPEFHWPDEAGLAALHQRARRSIGMDHQPVAPVTLPPKAVSWPLSPEDFVTEVYRGLLRREPDARGLADHCRSIEERNHPASRVLARFAGSEEFRRKYTLFSKPGSAPTEPQRSPPPAAESLLRLRMTAAEKASFTEAVGRCEGSYLEWGAGGSTAVALDGPAKRVISVESDAAWIERIRAEVDGRGADVAARLSLVHAAIGEVGAWGWPADRSRTDLWPIYPAAPWPLIDAEGCVPELILVDGRFRVACALGVALRLAERPGAASPLLLLHDAGRARPGYEAVLMAWDRVATVDSLWHLKLRPEPDMAALRTAYAAKIIDPE